MTTNIVTFSCQPAFGNPDQQLFFFKCTQPRFVIQIGDQCNGLKVWEDFTNGQTAHGLRECISDIVSIGINDGIVTFSFMAGENGNHEFELDMPFENCKGAFQQAYECVKLQFSD